jgi:hypothetical protein
VEAHVLLGDEPRAGARPRTGLTHLLSTNVSLSRRPRTQRGYCSSRIGPKVLRLATWTRRRAACRSFPVPSLTSGASASRRALRAGKPGAQARSLIVRGVSCELESHRWSHGGRTAEARSTPWMPTGMGSCRASLARRTAEGHSTPTPVPLWRRRRCFLRY